MKYLKKWLVLQVIVLSDTNHVPVHFLSVGYPSGSAEVNIPGKASQRHNEA